MRLLASSRNAPALLRQQEGLHYVLCDAAIRSPSLGIGGVRNRVSAEREQRVQLVCEGAARRKGDQGAGSAEDGVFLVPEPADEGADAYQGDDARRCASEGECDDEEAVDAGLEEESVLLEDGVVRVDSASLSGGAVEYVELCDCGKGCAGGEDEVASCECHLDCFLEERSCNCFCSGEMLLLKKGIVLL